MTRLVVITAKRTYTSYSGTVQQETESQVIVDGTNVDDLEEDRPGVQAARALGVRSPLVEAGIWQTKY